MSRFGSFRRRRTLYTFIVHSMSFPKRPPRKIPRHVQSRENQRVSVSDGGLQGIETFLLVGTRCLTSLRVGSLPPRVGSRVSSVTTTNVPCRRLWAPFLCLTSRTPPNFPGPVGVVVKTDTEMMSTDLDLTGKTRSQSDNPFTPLTRLSGAVRERGV